MADLIGKFGDLSDYANISNILNEQIYLSVSAYINLSGLDEATYGISSILDTILGGNATFAGLTDLLLAIAIDKFDNLVEIRLSVKLTIADLIGYTDSEDFSYDSIEAALEVIKTADDGSVEVLGGIYLIDNNAYIDISNYNNAPIIYIEDFASGLTDFIFSLIGTDEEEAEGGAMSTENDASAAGSTDQRVLIADILLGSAGFGLITYTDLVPLLLNIFGLSLGLEDIFDVISVGVMLNYEGATCIQDIGLDIDLTIGTLNIGLGLNNIIVEINSNTAIISEEMMASAENITELPFSIEAKAQILVKVNNGVIDLGTLLSKYIPNLTLEVNVPEEDGSWLGIDINFAAIVNLSNFNTLEIMLEIYMQGVTTSTLLLGAYYTGGVFYIDATGLGIEKIKITGMDIGDLLESAFGDVLKHDSGDSASAAAEGNIDRSLAALLLLLDGERVSIQIGAKLIEWILSMEAINIGSYIPDGVDISAYLDIRYIDEVTGKMDLSVALGLDISERAGLYLKIYDIGIGLTQIDLVTVDDPYSYTEIIRFNSPVLDEEGNKTYDTEGNLITETKIVLEHVSLSLEVDIFSLMTGDYDATEDTEILDFSDLIRPLLASVAENLVTQFQFPDGQVMRNLVLRLTADVEIMKLIEAIGSENIDIAEILSYVNLSLELVSYTSSEEGFLLFGIYLIDGAASLYLEGLGFPNITVSQEMISSILGAVLGSGEASAISTSAVGAADDTMTVIASILTT
jgi:hypothetical protein